MKLSQIQGERTIEVIAEVIEPICNIAQDKEASRMFRKEQKPEGMTAKDFTLERVKQSVPQLLKTHKKDMVRIMSAIDGVSDAEYLEKLNLQTFIADCVELLTDEVFRDLFLSQAQTEKSSGSASASITG